MSTRETSQHRLGLALTAAAALSWSTSGLFVRLISTDLMTMLFWRGVFSGLAIMTVFAIMERGRAIAKLKAMGRPDLAVAACSTFAMICGISSLRFTTVAEAVIIYALLPFIAAGAAWAFLGERPSRATILASLAALAGVAVMLWDAQEAGSLFGKLLALGMTVGAAGMTLILRRHREVSMLPALGASAWACSAIAFWFAAPLAVTAQDFGLIILFGVFQNAAGLTFYSFGSRRLPAAEATLIAALEVPLTPLLVWVVLNETPSDPVLLGGAIVLAALFGHILRELVAGRPAAAPAPAV